MTAALLHSPPVEIRFYDLRQTARAVGKSYDRFRKVRHAWTRDRDFPAEINEPGEAPRYLAAAVDAWLLRRTRRVLDAPAPALRPVEGGRPDQQRAAAGRAALRQIMGGAA